MQGGSDSLRSNFAESAFESIESQVTEAKQQVKQRTYGSTAEIQHIERVLKQEEIILKNPTDHLRVFEFFQQLQPYITLLVLKNVRIAYADGTGSQRIVKVSQLTELVNNELVDDEERKKLIQFVMNELSAVTDQDGQIHSLIQNQSQPGSISLIQNPTSTFLIKHANGDVQTISTSGLIIKAAKDWIEPTLTIIAVEKNSQA